MRIRSSALRSRNETEQIHRIPPPFAFVLLLKKTKSLPTCRDFSALFMVWKSRVKDVQRHSVCAPSPRPPRGWIRPPDTGGDAGAGGSALPGGLSREKQNPSATGSARDARDDCLTPNPLSPTPWSTRRPPAPLPSHLHPT